MIMKIMRTAIVCFIAWVAVSVPGFGAFVGFIGSFCGATLAFILPAIAHLVLFHGNMSRIKLALDYFVVAFGCTGMVFGVAESLKMMFVDGVEAG
jgi:amino acid permease